MEIWRDTRKRRWLIWSTLAVSFLLVNVYRLSTAVLSGRLASAFDATATELGLLHSSFFYIYAPLQVAAGVLADQAGIRRAATAGALVMNAGALAFALAGSYSVAFAGRLLVGIGASVIFIATLRFCANWYGPEEFATMSGLTMGIAGLGGMIAATPLAVAATTVGWRTTYAGLAVFGILAALAAYLMAHDHPTDAGLEPIENVPTTPELTVREVVDNAGRVLRGPETWLAGLVLFCFTGVNITVVGLWVIPYVVQTYGVSVTTASTLQLLPAAGILVGPPIIGRISDHFQQRTSLMVIGAVVFTALFSILAAPVRQPFLVVGLVLFGGSFLAGTSALAYTVVKDRYEAAASGVATGAVNGISFSGAAIFPVLMGAVLDRFWTGETVAGARVYTATGYRYMFGLAVLAGLFALVCALWLHRRSPS